MLPLYFENYFGPYWLQLFSLLEGGVVNLERKFPPCPSLYTYVNRPLVWLPQVSMCICTMQKVS